MQKWKLYEMTFLILNVIKLLKICIYYINDVTENRRENNFNEDCMYQTDTNCLVSVNK